MNSQWSNWVTGKRLDWITGKFFNWLIETISRRRQLSSYQIIQLLNRKSSSYQIIQLLNRKGIQPTPCKNLWVILVIACHLTGQAQARDGLGGREGDFLAWGAGARALALGKAYVAMATDATAAYWNPAGLAFTEQSEASALHALLWEGANYDFVGVALPTLALGNFGWFGSLLTSGALEKRDDENNAVAGGFGITKFGTGLGYGFDLDRSLGIGITAKWLGRLFDGESSGFVTMDLGLRWTAAPWLVVGGVLQHAASVTYGDTSDVLPPTIRVGVVMSPLPGWGLLVADLETKLTNPSWRWRVGMESAFLGPLALRVGLETWELAGGAGFTFEDLALDYSGAIHPDLGLSHRVSLGLKWGDARTAVRIEHAKTAFRRALDSFAEAERLGFGTTEAQHALSQARQALETVLIVDKDNPAAALMLKRVVAHQVER